MFAMTTKIIHKITLKALKEIMQNPIHLKWLKEYNLHLAFSSHVSWIVARDYNTVLSEEDFNILMQYVCMNYLECMDVNIHETR